MVCIFCAACDLGIADSGFRAATGYTGVGMLASLHALYERTEARFPKTSKTELLFGLMDFQFARLTSSLVRAQSHSECVARVMFPRVAAGMP